MSLRTLRARFSCETAIKENDQVRTTGRIVEVPAGEAMLGRVVNPLGMPIDGIHLHLLCL